MPSHTAVAALSRGVFDTITVETEQPGPDQILLKTEFAALIAFDTYITDFGYGVKQYPLTLGLNASGTIAQVGKEIEDLAVGDRVRSSLHSACIKLINA